MRAIVQHILSKFKDMKCTGSWAITKYKYICMELRYARTHQAQVNICKNYINICALTKFKYMCTEHTEDVKYMCTQRFNCPRFITACNLTFNQQGKVWILRYLMAVVTFKFFSSKLQNRTVVDVGGAMDALSLSVRFFSF